MFTPGCKLFTELCDTLAIRSRKRDAVFCVCVMCITRYISCITDTSNTERDRERPIRIKQYIYIGEPVLLRLPKSKRWNTS